MVKKRKPRKKRQTKKILSHSNPLSSAAVRLRLQGYPHALSTAPSPLHSKKRRKRKKKLHHHK